MKMKPKLSVLIITENAAETIGESLELVKGLADEIVAVDNCSSDSTVEILKNYGAKVFYHNEADLGKQRKYGLSKVNGEWVLVLDSDEIVSRELYNEIKELKSTKFQIPNTKKNPNSKSQNIKKVTSYKLQVTGFYIPFQNHFLGRPLYYGGEDYKKLWLFRKDAVSIEPALVHEHFKLKKGQAGKLKYKILHYSYRTLVQTYRKFTDYAIREAKQKVQKGERSSLKKIFLYPLHMFWARFIKDKGYRDGIFRIPLDLGFAYMEFITYLLLWMYSWKISNIKDQISK